MMSVKFLELAQSELDDAFEAYQYQEDNLGHVFVQEVSDTLKLIKTYPDIWSKSSTHTQRCLIKGFLMGYYTKEWILLFL